MKVQYKGFIRERIQRNPVTVGTDATFFDALNLIRQKGIRHLPVVDKNNRVVGIVTERDIREAAPFTANSLSVHELNYYSGHKESNNLHRDIVILRVLRGAELTSQSAFERNI